MRAILATLLAGFFSVIALGMLGAGAFWVKYEKPEPQPIAYPHDLHAGKLNLECTHCHVYVDKSQYATVPAMKICMDCHKDAQIVSPEIDKLKNSGKTRSPFPGSAFTACRTTCISLTSATSSFLRPKGRPTRTGKSVPSATAI